MGIKAGETVMGMWIFPVLALSLVLTMVLEAGFGWLLGLRGKWDMALVLLVNLLTNPAVVMIYYMNLLYIGKGQTAVVILSEVSAVMAEGLCYRTAAREISHPWLFAAGANLFSFTAGLLIRAFI